MLKKILEFFSSVTDYQKAEQNLAYGYSIAGRKLDGEGQPKQEDAFYISPPSPNGRLMLVADGLGGHAHGEFASNHTLSIFEQALNSLQEPPKDIPFFLRQQAMTAAAQVHRKGIDDPAYYGSGSTLCGFYLLKDQYFLINIGDSRAYLLNDNNILIRLSKDHSPVQEMLNKGLITEEEAAIHPQRNQMSSAIGMPLEQIRLDINGPFTIEKGEILLTFTDGIHDYLTDSDIQKIILEYATNESLAKTLVQAAFDAGSKDNITACFFRRG